MIVTRSWLEEYIDLSHHDGASIAKTLNAIGLEVDAYRAITIPKGVVVGKVLEVEAHPNADKLSVCQVDLGLSKRQIVCGARNVAKGQIVPVATIGAVMSPEFTIMPTKIRDVQSDGMICSSTEIGLPKLNDGILPLDKSIGELILGKELSEYPALNDEIFELGITPNRGDALSILGVARDLSVALKIPFKKQEKYKDENKKGVRTAINLGYLQEIDSKVAYKLIEFSNKTNNLLMQLRLTIVEELSDNYATNICSYVTHDCGVVFRRYDFDAFYDSTKEKAVLSIKKDENHCDCLYDSKGEKYSVIGIEQIKHAKNETQKVIFEASYVKTNAVAELVFSHKLKTDRLYYKSSRGASSMIEEGMNRLGLLMDKFFDCEIYSGFASNEKTFDKKVLKVPYKKIESIVGKKIPDDEVFTILQDLGFETTMNHEQQELVVKIPKFRQDVENIADVVEEIVRMYGINKIESKPLAFFEQKRLGVGYQNFSKSKELLERAVGGGFFETINYVFASKERLLEYGFEVVVEDLDLVNPINNDLNTLRTTLLLNLLDAVVKNTNNGQKSLKLVEIGDVYDARRNQTRAIGFIASGYASSDGVDNHGKPKPIDFQEFVNMIAKIIGEFTLVGQEPTTNALIHPYQSGQIVVNGKTIGMISKLHTKVQNELGILDTFFAQVEFDAIDFSHKNMVEYSRFQHSTKDLTIAVQTNLEYNKIATFIENKKYTYLKRYHPVDYFIKNKTDERANLTIRFVLQAMERSFGDDEVNLIMEKIFHDLKSEFEQ